MNTFQDHPSSSLYNCEIASGQADYETSKTKIGRMGFPVWPSLTTLPYREEPHLLTAWSGTEDYPCLSLPVSLSSIMPGPLPLARPSGPGQDLAAWGRIRIPGVRLHVCERCPAGNAISRPRHAAVFSCGFAPLPLRRCLASRGSCRGSGIKRRRHQWLGVEVV